MTYGLQTSSRHDHALTRPSFVYNSNNIINVYKGTIIVYKLLILRGFKYFFFLLLSRKLLLLPSRAFLSCIYIYVYMYLHASTSRKVGACVVQSRFYFLWPRTLIHKNSTTRQVIRIKYENKYQLNAHTRAPFPLRINEWNIHQTVLVVTRAALTVLMHIDRAEPSDFFIFFFYFDFLLQI